MCEFILLTKSSAVSKLSHVLSESLKMGQDSLGPVLRNVDQDTGFNPPSFFLKFRVCVETSRAANATPGLLGENCHIFKLSMKEK